jgi:hypothetical protein
VAKKTMTGVVLALATTAALALAPPASAQSLPDPANWAKSKDYQSHYLCRSAGLTGEFFGLWREGDWMCVGATLYVRQHSPAPGIG